MKKPGFGFLVLLGGWCFLLWVAGCSQGSPPILTPTPTLTSTPTPTVTPTLFCPTATLTVQAPASIISGQEITFQVNVGGELPPGTTFVWNFGDGTGNREGPTVSHTYTSGSGIAYTVTVTAQLPAGYESCTPPSATFEVLVVPGPVHNRTQNTFHTSIQEAIDGAKNGDVIAVSPGTYRESIDFRGKNLTLQNNDPNDPALVAQTVIEGNGGSVVTFKDGCSQARLVGFTIQGGNGTTVGGGIYIKNASPIINGNRIHNNTVSLGGGGIGIVGSSYPQIIDNLIEDNRANWGGGIFVGDGSLPVIYGNTICHNETVNAGSETGLGGGIYVHTLGDVKNQQGDLWPRENCPPAGQVVIGDIWRYQGTRTTWRYQGNIFSNNHNANGATEGCHVYFRNIVIYP